MNTQQAAAAAYLSGFMPIPLRTDEGQRKRPKVQWRQYQQHRPGWQEIESWFDDANLAIVTGKVSGCVVVDLDGQIPEPRAWLAKHGFNVETPIVSTGRGGAHVYYKHPGGVVPNGVKLSVIDGVSLDIRADGGYVVAPPSLHDTGAFYEWAHGDWSMPLAPFPQELHGILNRVTEYGVLKASDVLSSDIEDIMRSAPKGQRNHQAAKVAGFWLKVTKGDELAAWQGTYLWNLQNEPPLPDVELRRTFESIARRERLVTVEHPDEADGEGAADPLPLMSGAEWAAAVRNIPPRHGTSVRSIPGLHEVGGLVPRDLILLAGRPGMGKSTCAWNTVAEVSLQGPKLPAIIFSTEMTAADVARWMGAKLFDVDQKQLTPAQWNQTCDLIARAPITMCDAGAVTADMIVEIVSKRPETRLVIVDHVQRVVDRSAKGDNRNLEVGRTAVALKSLAKDVGCTVLALSQMNRASDGVGRPRLSSLRDSGELEQEADAVIFLWTSAENITAPELDVEFYLAKNRHGALTEIPCVFKKATKTFVQKNLAGEIERVKQRQAYTEAVNALRSGIAE